MLLCCFPFATAPLLTSSHFCLCIPICLIVFLCPPPSAAGRLSSPSSFLRTTAPQPCSRHRPHTRPPAPSRSYGAAAQSATCEYYLLLAVLCILPPPQTTTVVALAGPLARPHGDLAVLHGTNHIPGPNSGVSSLEKRQTAALLAPRQVFLLEPRSHGRSSADRPGGWFGGLWPIPLAKRQSVDVEATGRARPDTQTHTEGRLLCAIHPSSTGRSMLQPAGPSGLQA